MHADINLTQSPTLTQQGQQAAIPPNNLVTIDKRLIRNAVLMCCVLARQNADWQRILKAIEDLEGCAR